MTPSEYLSKIGGNGGRKAAKRLGKTGLSERAKRGWRTRKRKRKTA